MAFSYSALQTAMQEVGRPLFFEQANMEAPLVDLKMAKGQKDRAKVFAMKKEPRSVISVTVKKGGYNSTAFVADGGARTQAAQLDHSIGKMGFAIIQGNIFFPEGITKVASGGEGIDLFKSAIESSGADFGRTLDRACIDHRLGGASGSAAAAAVSLDVLDASGYRPGAKVDQYNSAGTILEGSFAVTDVTVNADGSGTLTIASPGLPGPVTTSSRFYLQGSGGAAAPGVGARTAPTNLADFTNVAVSCFPNLTATEQPAGTLDSTTTSLSNTKMRNMMTRVKTVSSKVVSHILVHPLNYERIENNQNPQLRFKKGDTQDVYGESLAFGKAQVVEDTNQGVAVVDFIHANENVAYMHEFWAAAPKKGWTKDALRESDTYVGDNLYITGGYNLVPRQRNAFGRMNAITG